MSPTLLPHVDEPKLSALQLRLESISKLSVDFIVLLAGSTMIATLGLFQNSPAVIIGAMIIAPLMRPLVGLSLATISGDSRLLLRASVTLLAGTVVGAFIAATMAFFVRSLELTPEILGRTHPNLLDLGVALFAGAVGAYCQAKEELADTLAGVAIAVALVPPLSVVGIGLAFNAVPVWSGAALLYATNLIGITVAGAIVFLIMGYTPLKLAKKGLAISAAVTVLLIVPLALSMRELVLENQISSSVRQILKEKTFTFRGVQLHNVQVKRFRTPMSVVATVLGSDQPITAHQVKLVQDFLSREIGIPVEFKLRIIPSVELTAVEVTSEDAQNTNPTPVKDVPMPAPDQSPSTQHEQPSVEPSVEQSKPAPENDPMQSTPLPETPAPKPVDKVE
jgi:uncharacterized hydrophobic protein (TIGR00271 family)